MENKERMKFTGSKMNRFKAMLSVGIITSAMLLTPGLMSEAHAAGKAQDTQVTQSNNYVRNSAAGKMGEVRVYKPSPQQLKKVQTAVNNFEKQRKDLGISDNPVFASSGNIFIDSMNVNNPESPYYKGKPCYQSNDNNVNSCVSKDGAQIKGNDSIGKTINGEER